MRKFFVKSALILCGLLLAITLVGYFVPQDENTAAVPVVAEKVLVPGGQSVGVKMDVRGVLVVGLEEISCSDGEKVNPGLLAGLQIGDSIVQVNGQDVSKADEVQTIVNQVHDTVILKVRRNGRLIDITVSPVVSAEDGLYKLGVWVKDKTAGIGTLTYFDPSDSTFGALGHGITDPETGSVLPVEKGLLLESQVQEVEEGRSGEPGEIKGLFYHASQPLGNLNKNSGFGVFGTAYHPVENPLYSKPLAIGTRDQVRTGKAYILSTLASNEVRRFEIEIVKVEKQKKPADKGMVIRVTDKELLEESGGIVQGMSGSPIIQNDRIIGAVTHVFVSDPAQGYGIFIEWMLRESDLVEK